MVNFIIWTQNLYCIIIIYIILHTTIYYTLGDVSFAVSLKDRMNTQSICRWCEKLWCSCDVTVMIPAHTSPENVHHDIRTVDIALEMYLQSLLDLSFKVNLAVYWPIPNDIYIWYNFVVFITLGCILPIYIYIYLYLGYGKRQSLLSLYWTLKCSPMVEVQPYGSHIYAKGGCRY